MLYVKVCYARQELRNNIVLVFRMSESTLDALRRQTAMPGEVRFGLLGV